MVILLLTIVLFPMGKNFPKNDIRWFVVFDSSLTFVVKCYMASLRASQVAPVVKNLPTTQETIPGLGGSPREEKDSLLQCSCLSLVGSVHGVPKGQVQQGD